MRHLKVKLVLLIILATVILTNCSSLKISSNNGFPANEIRLIMNSDSLTPMRIYKINNKIDSLLLRTKSGYIKPNPHNKILQNFTKRLYATVRDSMSMGVGIAAPQVGILKSIIWVQRFDKDNFPFELYLNPKIVRYSNQKQSYKEGCLSIPNRTDTLHSRALSISLEYDTIDAKHKTETVQGFTSVIFQHEIDHLNGILYLDHLKKEQLEANNKK